MRITALLLATALLAACGADGPPEAPTMNSTVTIGTGGVYGSTSVSQGPVSIRLGTRL